jgi:hypothetical protein
MGLSFINVRSLEPASFPPKPTVGASQFLNVSEKGDFNAEAQRNAEVRREELIVSIAARICGFPAQSLILDSAFPTECRGVTKIEMLNGPRLWRSPAAGCDCGNRIRMSKPHLDANSNTLRLGSAPAAVRFSSGLVWKSEMQQLGNAPATIRCPFRNAAASCRSMQRGEYHILNNPMLDSLGLLMRHGRAALLRFHALKEENERQTRQAEDAEQTKVFDECPKTALGQQLIVDAAQRLRLRQDGA